MECDGDQQISQGHMTCSNFVAMYFNLVLSGSKMTSEAREPDEAVHDFIHTMKMRLAVKCTKRNDVRPRGE